MIHVYSSFTLPEIDPGLSVLGPRVPLCHYRLPGASPIALEAWRNAAEKGAALFSGWVVCQAVNATACHWWNVPRFRIRFCAVRFYENWEKWQQVRRIGKNIMRRRFLGNFNIKEGGVIKYSRCTMTWILCKFSTRKIWLKSGFWQVSMRATCTEAPSLL